MRFRSQGQNLPIGLAQQAGSPILLELKSQQSSLVPRLPLARHRRHWSPQDERTTPSTRPKIQTPLGPLARWELPERRLQ